jgi:hypothetical protein
MTGKSKMYRKVLPCLKLYINLTYKDDGKIDYIKIYSGNKDNDCGGSFFESLADLLTFSIRRMNNDEAKAIIKSLKGHKCNKAGPNEEHITSCVDAISRVLQAELIK